MQPLVHAHGAALVHGLIHCACGALPSYLVPDLSEVVFRLRALAPALVQQAAHTAPDMQRFPNHQVNPLNKEAFLALFDPYVRFYYPAPALPMATTP